MVDPTGVGENLISASWFVELRLLDGFPAQETKMCGYFPVIKWKLIPCLTNIYTHAGIHRIFGLKFIPMPSSFVDLPSARSGPYLQTASPWKTQAV